MKLDKNILKSIVKECLIEILAEGIVNNGSTRRSTSEKKRQLSESLATRKRTANSERSLANIEPGNINTRSDTPRRPSYLDSISFGKKQDMTTRDEKANNIATSLTENPVMQDIFADTAKTTLREQVSAESKRHGMVSKPADNAARIVSEHNPEDLFGEASQKWAQLAFM